MWNIYTQTSISHHLHLSPLISLLKWTKNKDHQNQLFITLFSSCLSYTCRILTQSQVHLHLHQLFQSFLAVMSRLSPHRNLLLCSSRCLSILSRFYLRLACWTLCSCLDGCPSKIPYSLSCPEIRRSPGELSSFWTPFAASCTTSDAWVHLLRSQVLRSFLDEPMFTIYFGESSGIVVKQVENLLDFHDFRCWDSWFFILMCIKGLKKHSLRMWFVHFNIVNINYEAEKQNILKSRMVFVWKIDLFLRRRHSWSGLAVNRSMLRYHQHGLWNFSVIVKLDERSLGYFGRKYGWIIRFVQVLSLFDLNNLTLLIMLICFRI